MDDSVAALDVLRQNSGSVHSNNSIATDLEGELSAVHRGDLVLGLGDLLGVKAASKNVVGESGREFGNIGQETFHSSLGKLSKSLIIGREDGVDIRRKSRCEVGGGHGSHESGKASRGNGRLHNIGNSDHRLGSEVRGEGNLEFIGGLFDLLHERGVDGSLGFFFEKGFIFRNANIGDEVRSITGTKLSLYLSIIKMLKSKPSL